MAENPSITNPSALLPCPFCGGEAQRTHNSFYGDDSMATCRQCGATAFHIKWNRRSALTKPEGE